MVREDAYAAVERRLGFLSGKRAVVVEEMRFAQARLEAGVLSPLGGVFWPWFLFTYRQVPAETGTIILPSDYLADAEGASVWVSRPNDPVRHPLVRVGLDELIGNTGMPQRYEITGTELHVDPVPGELVTLHLYYYGADRAVTEVPENKWLRYAPGLLIAVTARDLALSMQMQGAAQAAQQLVEEEQRRLWSAHSARVELHERDYRIGDME